jgi:hypothetical protein
MKLRRTAIVVAMLGTAAMMQTAQAAFTDNLADLVANDGSLSIGDKTFSDFSYLASALTGFNAANVTVTASVDGSGVYFLTWSGNVAALASLTPTTGDLLLNYRVSASAGVIAKIDQGYTGSGIVSVVETVSPSSGGVPITSTITLPLTGVLNPDSADNIPVVPPSSSLYVTKDIGLAVLPDGSFASDFATISQVEQSFHQVAVPEPTTVIAGILLMLPLGVSTLRILRRNRIA